MLDRRLRGGILSRGLTDIAGQSASGKTQLCLQLALSVQRPLELGGLAGEAAYICTEGPFPYGRLVAMARASGHLGDSEDIAHVTDRIHVAHAHTVGALSYLVQHHLPALLAQRSVRLIIVDSIAAPFRCEFERDEFIERARQLHRLAHAMKRMSDQWHVPVVCVNQVTDTVGDARDTATATLPALGLQWANLVQVRLLLSRSSTACDATQPPRRYLSVDHAPHLPNIQCEFVIGPAGIRAVPCADDDGPHVLAVP